jgi:hypothetical protein
VTVDSPGFDLVAASLRADATDLEAFVEALAERLGGAFPTSLRVERSGNRFSRRRRVERLELDLGEERFELVHEPGRPRCLLRTLVGGVAIRSDELPLEAWLDQLARALLGEAEASAQGRAALARLLQ